MKLRPTAWCSLLLLTLAPCAWADSTLPLARMRQWRIVVAADAIPSEKYAAEEFRDLFQKAAGVQLPLETAPAGADGNIFIGPSQSQAPSAVAVATDDLGDEGLRIRITPENIAVAGGRPRGTLYGVYEFMERYFGVRFLTDDHTYVPATAPEQLPCETWRYVPPFTFRWSYYKENVDYPEFAARLRVNTVTHAAKLGGVTPQNLISHSLGQLLPASKYGKEHPEYFALVDGERKLEMGGGGPELCVSNPDVIEIVAQNVIKELDAHPGMKNISVSQNDNAAYCRCPRCEAINQREGTPMGAHLMFVNAVADRVAKKYPDVKIGTLAYWYTRKAPKTIRPRPNVQIQLCSIECSTLYPLDDPSCAKNRPFCDDMNAWSQMCQDIWIWNYNTNFRYYDLPFPNLRVISPNIQYFLKNRVKGVFMQANGNGGSGELCDLRNYVISRCLWDPNLDSWELTKEFCRLHYGKAAGTMIDYLTYLHDNARRAGFEPTCFPMPFEVGINPASADRIFGYFKQALSEADDETVRSRVEKASIAADRAVLEVCGQWDVRDGKLRVGYPAKYGPIVADYKALTQKYGEARAEEWQPISHYYTILDHATEEGIRAESLENDTWRLAVLGDDQGRLVELRHKPDGRDLLSPPDFRTLRHLFENLIATEIGVEGFGKGEPDFTIEKQGAALVLKRQLADGSAEQRRIWFDDQDPNIVRFRTEITHRGSAAKKYQVRVHPELNTGRVTQDSDVVSAYINDGTWWRFNEGWKGGSGPGQARLEKAKGGGYSFFNHRDGYGAELQYDPNSFGRAAFWWSDTFPQANLDLYTKTVELKPGESLAFEYSLKYLAQAPGPR